MRALIHRLRGVAARSVSASGTYHVLQRALGRLSGGFILAYHNLPPDRFVAHVRALQPHRPVPLGELVARHVGGQSTAGLFAITFDDGVAATVCAVAEVARAEQWPVTFFIPTDYVENPRGMPFQWLRAIQGRLPRERLVVGAEQLDLSAPGARETFVEHMTQRMYTRPRADYEALLRALADTLVARGLVASREIEPPPAVTWDEIARFARDPLLRFESHGVSHAAVSALDPAELERELQESRDLIRAHTNVPCEHFCYPFGGGKSIGDAAPRAVARHYKSAVTMQRGRLGRRSPHLLPRIPLYPHDDGAMVRLKVLTP